MRFSNRTVRLQGEQLEARQMLTVPDFVLPNINEGSDSYGENISPRDYMGDVSAWYFIRSFCSYCRSQQAFLHDLQDQFARNFPSLGVSILIVDDKGAKTSDEQLATDIAQDLPFLRDTGVAWTSWQAAWRDVKIVDRANEFGSTINLTTHNLAVAENFETLKEMLIDAAKRPPATAHQSPIEPLDVNADSVISPIDALGVINELGKYDGGTLPALQPGQTPANFVDVNGDGMVSPGDALAVINQLNVISRMDQAGRSPLSGGAGSSELEDEIDALPPIATSKSNLNFGTRPEMAGVMLGEIAASAKVDHATLLAASRTPVRDWRLSDSQDEGQDDTESVFDLAVADLAAL